MFEETFKDDDFGTNVKESTITGTPFQRRSSRSVLTVRNPSSGSATESSCASSPKRPARSESLKRSNSLASLRTMSLSRRLTNAEVDPWADASPVLPISKKFSGILERQCHESIEFLLRLQEPPYSRTSASEEPMMPPTALKFSKGLAFIKQHKAGLVTSWVWGSGFVIARLGPGRWSAPCFLYDKFLACGVTCGYRVVDTCYAIPTNEGMKHFKVDSLNSAFDLGLTLGYDPLQGEAPIATAETADRTTGRYAVKPSERPRVFSMSDGIILDFSWRLGMHLIDDKRHQELYGPDVSPVDILEGKVQIPEEFKPFYDTIAALAAVGDVAKPTVSMFEVEKEKNKLKSQPSLVSSLSFQRHQMGKLNSSGSSSDHKTHYSNSSSMNDTALIRTSLPDSIGSEQSTVSSLPMSGGSDRGENNNNSSFRLFGDANLLDLDLDTPEEGEIKPDEPTCQC